MELQIEHAKNVDNKQIVKSIINSIKYLKKMMNRISIDTLSNDDKQKLYSQYEELLDVITNQIQ
jgi:hypothetical protein